MAPATLAAPDVIEVARDGTVRQRWSIADAIDPSRIGWQSLQDDALGKDWAHANSVVVDPSDGGLVVSLRHQDAVIKLDRQTGALVWILSNPDGWRPPYTDRLLQGSEGTTWPYHQHAAMVTDEGHILMFDNGNFDRTTPYSGTDDGEGYYSRMVEYRIDPDAGTVDEVWSHHQTSTGPLFSGTFGDADRLEGTRLGVFGRMYTDAGVSKRERRARPAIGAVARGGGRRHHRVGPVAVERGDRATRRVADPPRPAPVDAVPAPPPRLIGRFSRSFGPLPVAGDGHRAADEVDLVDEGLRGAVSVRMGLSVMLAYPETSCRS